jgi:hypothetical protein
VGKLLVVLYFPIGQQSSLFGDFELKMPDMPLLLFTGRPQLDVHTVAETGGIPEWWIAGLQDGQLDHH